MQSNGLANNLNVGENEELTYAKEESRFDGHSGEYGITETLYQSEPRLSHLQHFRGEKRKKPHTSLLSRIKTFFRTHHAFTVLRAIVSLFCGAVLIWVTPSLQFFGVDSFILGLSIILYDHSLTRGSSILSMFLFLFTFSIGSGLTAFSFWTARLIGDFDQFAIFWLWLWSVCFAYARVSLTQKWAMPVIVTHFTFVFSLLRALNRPDPQYDTIFKTFFAMACGTIISTLCTIVIKPRSGSEALRKEMKRTLDTMKVLFDTTLRVWLGTASTEDEQKLIHHENRIRAHLTSLSKRLDSLQWEITYSRWDKQSIQIIVSFFQQTLVHLKSMGSSCRISEDLKRKNDKVETVVRSLGPPLEIVEARIVELLDQVSIQLHLDREDCKEGQQFVNTKRLSQSVQKFHDVNKGVTEDIIHKHGWETEGMPLVYFFIFSLLKCSEEITNIILFMNEGQGRERFHFPHYFHNYLDSVAKYFQLNRELVEQRENRSKQDGDGKVKRDDEKKKSKIVYRWRKLTLTLWEISRFFTTKETKYAIKVSIAVVFTTMWQFIRVSNDWYISWRGAWAAVTVIFVYSPSVGDNVIQTILRILGTLLGAGWSILSWLAFPGNPYGLSLMLVLCSIPSFYIKMNTKYPKMGTIIIITFDVSAYTIVTLGRYAAGEFSNVGVPSIYELAYKRSVMTVGGCLVILIIDRLLWPNLARVQLRHTLSTIIREVTLIYGTTVRLLYSKEESLLLDIQRAQTTVSLQLAKAESLLESSIIEPRMKGPFPVKEYRKIIRHIGILLDRTVTARLAVRGDFGQDIWTKVIEPLRETREDLVAKCLLLFWISESSMLWKKKLPHYIPDIKATREKLLRDITQLEYFQQTKEVASSTNLISYLTWLNSYTEVSIELGELLSSLKYLFGEEPPIQNFVINLY
ncbi:hypothetical protein PROFUN_09013 [Planoprotostelium fungivorum]|uniref:Uncharacterized protein n=1 Tax=Planoprotostelium fungivorum TaxID=1890364 RepID=A0A2P6MV10_9EUKA|nr:hypothetical protein PROFUN_09013 [Planoprotostelium fungivorum]